MKSADCKESRHSLESIAAATGLDRRTVKRALAQAGIAKPPAGGWGDDALDAARAAAAARTDAGELKRQGLALRNDLLREELAAARGENIPRARVDAALTSLAAQIDGILKSKLVVEWPGQAQGLPADQLRVLGERVHGEIVDLIRTTKVE